MGNFTSRWISASNYGLHLKKKLNYQESFHIGSERGFLAHLTVRLCMFVCKKNVNKSRKIKKFLINNYTGSSVICHLMLLVLDQYGTPVLQKFILSPKLRDVKPNSH